MAKLPPVPDAVQDAGRTVFLFVILGWFWLVVSTPLKNMLVKLGIFPNIGGEIIKYLKPPPSDCLWRESEKENFYSTSSTDPKWNIDVFETFG